MSTNRLARSTSPYLLQHAHNPVDWFPWGPEAFAEARRRDVPIFLSIGYSTCYWCHVMERESFEDPAIGRLLAEKFVSIKVDREERPDVDDIYMQAVLLLTGRGGWPMSVFLDPHTLRPFWGGTYFPPKPAHGMPSFSQVLHGISDAYASRRPDITEQSSQLAAAITERLALLEAPKQIGVDHVSKAVTALLTTFDRARGGFGGAPKFPQPALLDFLLTFRPHAGDDATRSAVDAALTTTLDKMALGGIHDQIAGGFHRYSVDALWLVPHFEKMLYDNALLAAIYSRAAHLYSDSFYARIARSTLDYILRELTLSAPNAARGFASAQDAEVDGREGLNYLWTPDQLRAALPPADAQLAIDVYGLASGTNFKDPHHPHEPASNVLFLEARPAHTALRLGMSESAFLERLTSINSTLYAARSQRRQPRLDDKVLTAWNGMAIAAFAIGARTLNDDRYARAARSAADFILSTHRDAAGTLLRASRNTSAHTPAFLEDHAFLIQGLIELARTLRPSDAPAADRYQREALALAAAARRLFAASDSLAFFDTLADQPDLFVRARSTHDGAVPSGSGAMIHALIDLADLTADPAHLDSAIAALAAVSSDIADSPISAINSTRALLRLLTTAQPRLAAALASAAPADSDAHAPAGHDLVEVFASDEELQVADDAPAEFTLKLVIAPGYHINAADPGPAAAGLIPLRLSVIGGTGLRVYADYPAGSPLSHDHPILVHEGEFTFPVAIERDGEWSGRPVLALTYQVCSSTECLAPSTVELDVRIDRP